MTDDRATRAAGEEPEPGRSTAENPGVTAGCRGPGGDGAADTHPGLHPSMVEQELPAVQQRPENVLIRLGLVRALAERGEKFIKLLAGRAAREGPDVQLHQPLLGVLLGGEELGDKAPLLDLGVDGVAVE